MDFSKIKKSILKFIPKKFKKQSLFQKRKELDQIKLKLLQSNSFLVFEEMEKVAREKGINSQEMSKLKSKITLNFCEQQFGIKLTPAQKSEIAQLMAQLEEREREVKAFKRNPHSDQMANNLRAKLQQEFGNKKRYADFIITYRLYNSEVRSLLKKVGQLKK